MPAIQARDQLQQEWVLVIFNLYPLESEKVLLTCVRYKWNTGEPNVYKKPILLCKCLVLENYTAPSFSGVIFPPNVVSGLWLQAAQQTLYEF